MLNPLLRQDIVFDERLYERSNTLSLKEYKVNIAISGLNDCLFAVGVQVIASVSNKNKRVIL